MSDSTVGSDEYGRYLLRSAGRALDRLSEEPVVDFDRDPYIPQSGL